ncbi:LVIVD repeat-containing protein [Algiphilus aromaticivorans]|uniref:LVIVD repeat-containing protein n=1 Tax=Algiphilus aromaticivorans TaxID=382454 RepID=UPI0005C16516|nr:hypothetical protein [Algiphilus aromaticivorans]
MKGYHEGQRSLLAWLWPGLAALSLLACSGSMPPEDSERAVARLADCGPGSAPEPGLQGRVSRADRDSGRNLEAYSCNMRLVGQYQGQGASVVSASSGDCAYMSSGPVAAVLSSTPGMQVVDVTNPASPEFAGNHASPGMLLGTWESLKVNEARGLLGGVAVGVLTAPGFFDVYDISEDCANPIHRNGLLGTSLELPSNILGHEGNWSPDGRTYWSTGLIAGSITAIDVEDPAQPRILYTGLRGFPSNHGVEFSPDGNRMYLATCLPGGIITLDISAIQNREPVPAVQQVSQITWNSRSCAQHALPVFFDGVPHLIAADEFASEGVRIIDISDETQPEIIEHIQLEIQLPENAALRHEDVASNGAFGYEAHYCDVDRVENPTALACGYFNSGIRVFDIRDPREPVEIAYFNPPAVPDDAPRLHGSLHAYGGGILPHISDQNASGSAPGALGPYILRYVASVPELLSLGLGAVHGEMSADWCSSPPRFVDDRLWVTCMDNGFMVLEFTNGVYPLGSGGT